MTKQEAMKLKQGDKVWAKLSDGTLLLGKFFMVGEFNGKTRVVVSSSGLEGYPREYAFAPELVMEA